MVVFRVRGVPIRVGWSWLVIVALVYWSLSAVLFPTSYEGLATWVYLVMAAVATVLLFGSLLVHELCHTLQSLREGVRIKDITLFLFGGVSQADEPIPGPGAEFRIVAAGPAASAVLMVLFGILAFAGNAAGLSDPSVGVLSYLARINGLLLVFNVIPALPLDGGRLLHALLWWRTGDHERATLLAAWSGRIFAILIISLGVVFLALGDTVGGVWFAAIGWFLYQAVGQEVAAARATQAFTGLHVRDLMTAPPVTLAPDMTIAELAERLDALHDHSAYPVVAGGRYVGTLMLSHAGAVPESRRGSVRVVDVMTPAELVAVLHPDDEVVDAAQTLGASVRSGADVPMSSVVLGGESGDEPVGVLSTADLERAIAAAPLRSSQRQS
jgi:Zn-dependent protease